MKVRILKPHCMDSMSKRGARLDEVIHTVKHGTRSKAKYGRTKFTHRFAYNKQWLGKRYRHKTIDAFAVDEAKPPQKDDWLVITVIVYYS